MEVSLCSGHPQHQQPQPVLRTAPPVAQQVASNGFNGAGGPLTPLKTAPKKAAILHVRENSLDELDALFDPAKWAQRQQAAKLPPLSKRNLPASFFQPPGTPGTKTPKSYYDSAGSNGHSRQSSIDQAYLTSNALMLNKQHLLLQQKLSSLSNNNNNHLRSISEPVNISPQAYAGLVAAQQQQPVHQMPVPSTGHANGFYSPANGSGGVGSGLPFGWQAARTNDGHIYYINHLTKQTSWTLPTSVHGTQPQSSAAPTTTGSNAPSASNSMHSFVDPAQVDLTDDLMSASSSPVVTTGPLHNHPNPHFNHHHHQPMHHQHHPAPAPPITGTLSAASSTFSSAASSVSASVSTSHDDLYNSGGVYQSSASSATITGGDEVKVEQMLAKMAMPSGWQRACTAAGELYYINHNTKSTCWEDPRLALLPAFIRQQQQIEAKKGGAAVAMQQQQQQQQQLHMHFGEIEQIKNTLVESMSKKKELVRILDELNKKESFLRSQLNQALVNLTSSMASANATIAPHHRDLVNVNGDENLADLNLDLTATIEQTAEPMNSAAAPSSTRSNNSNSGTELTSSSVVMTMSGHHEAELDSVSSMYNKLLIHNNNNNQNVGDMMMMSQHHPMMHQNKLNNSGGGARTTLSSLSLNSDLGGAMVVKKQPLFDNSLFSDVSAECSNGGGSFATSSSSLSSNPSPLGANNLNGQSTSSAALFQIF